MQREEIDEGNMLIAEFMGWVNTNNYSWKVLENNKWVTKTDREGLTFHYSWDTLMPVVEKIESLRLKVYGFGVYEYFNVLSYPTMCTISSGLKNSDENITSPYYYNHTCFGENKLNTLWRSVVEFIKRYNSWTKEK